VSDGAKPAWLQATLAAPAEQAERVAAALTAAGAVSVSYGDAGDQPVLEPAPGETPLWPETRLTGLFDAHTEDAEAIATALTNSLGPLAATLGLEPLEQRDWARAWMEGYRPMRFGRRLWVCPHHLPAADPAAITLRLDPGLAFGSGTHPTTALCLEWLDAHPPADTVLDYGCGSGILAVAAALLGAAQVVAVDIDPQALTATRDNAAHNGVGDRVRACSPESCPPGQAQVVLANILAGPLITLAPLLAARVQAAGSLVLSGLLVRHAEPVLAAYSPWLELAAQAEREGWLRLEWARRGPPPGGSEIS
jgi:ribosomal protein L11 methyltransferase